MQNDWPTQTQDLEIATDIINRHVELNDGEPLGMIEIVIDKKQLKPIEIRVPEWIQELIHHFRDHYGYEQGQVIASKIITKMLLQDETIH